jgi:hypothetical protein
MKNRIEKSKPEKVTEFTVKIRIRPERLEWFSLVSDQLGLTRDQAVSAMLDSNMEADEDGLRIEEAQGFIVDCAASLFPERKTLRLLSDAFEAVEAGERKLEEVKGRVLIELSDIMPKEMGLRSLRQTKSVLLKESLKKQKVGKMVAS